VPISDINTYGAGTLGEFLPKARADLVTLLTSFKDTLNATGINPNINDVFDYYADVAAHPYITVELLEPTIEYLSRSTASYHIRVDVPAQVVVHFGPLDGKYQTQQRWTLLQSLLNFLKDYSTPGSNVDAMYLQRIQEDVMVPKTGFHVAIITMNLLKVLAT